MTRVKYQTITEGAGAGALESTKNVTLADGRTVRVVLDPNTFEFGIYDVNAQGTLLKTGSGKHLNAAKRNVRTALLELGASVGAETRHSAKRTIAQAAAQINADASDLESSGS